MKIFSYLSCIALLSCTLSTVTQAKEKYPVIATDREPKAEAGVRYKSIKLTSSKNVKPPKLVYVSAKLGSSKGVSGRDQQTSHEGGADITANTTIKTSNKSYLLRLKVRATKKKLSNISISVQYYGKNREKARVKESTLELVGKEKLSLETLDKKMTYINLSPCSLSSSSSTTQTTERTGNSTDLTKRGLELSMKKGKAGHDFVGVIISVTDSNGTLLEESYSHRSLAEVTKKDQ